MKFNYLDSILLEINLHFEDISFQKFAVSKEQHLQLGRVLKILGKCLKQKFFWNDSSSDFFLRFFSKFAAKLFNRAPVDGCLCIEKTCKTLNTTSKISIEVHFLRKHEHFRNTDQLHSSYSRTRFRWLLLKFAIIFSTETFSVTVVKKKLLFDNSRLCWILRKIAEFWWKLKLAKTFSKN